MCSHYLQHLLFPNNSNLPGAAGKQGCRESIRGALHEGLRAALLGLELILPRSRADEALGHLSGSLPLSFLSNRSHQSSHPTEGDPVESPRLSQRSRHIPTLSMPAVIIITRIRSHKTMIQQPCIECSCVRRRVI